MDIKAIAAAGVTAITLYLLGLLSHRLFGLPGPVVMLFVAVMLKLSTPRRRRCRMARTASISSARRLAPTPSCSRLRSPCCHSTGLVIGLHPANLITIVVTVAHSWRRGLRSRAGQTCTRSRRRSST